MNLLIAIHYLLSFLLSAFYIFSFNSFVSKQNSNNFGDLFMLLNFNSSLFRHISLATTGQLFSANPKRASILNKDFFLQFKNKHVKKCTTSIVAVTTTIKSSTKCIAATAEHIPVIVVGDISSRPWSPPKIVANNTIFLSIADQNKFFPEFSSIIPAKSFARKNIGYIYAIQQLNACIIYDFDDDNCPTIDTVKLLKQISLNGMPHPDLLLSSPSYSNFINPYILYGSEEFVWPRGFAFQEIGRREHPYIKKIDSNENLSVEILQIMQNIDPDVDSIWRLLNAHKQLPMKWKSDKLFSQKIAVLNKFKYCPFNSQSVLLTNLAATIGFLPFTVSGRVSDIWRSFIMQYFFHHMKSKGNTAFTGHYVDHFRNSHNYLADYDAEKQLFEQSAALVNYLASRPLSKKNSNLAYEYIKLMDDLYVRGFIEKEDVFAAIEWSKLMPMEEKLTNINAPHKIDQDKLNATVFIGTSLKNAPFAKSLYNNIYQSVIPIELYVDECNGKINGESILCMPSYEKQNIIDFVHKNLNLIEKKWPIIFATFGRKLPSEVIIKNNQFKVLNKTAKYITSDFLIISENFNDETLLMDNFNLKNDVIRYYDPYECINKTLLYLMITSKNLQHYNKEYLPSLLLYFPAKYAMGHTFSLDDIPAEHQFLHWLNNSYKYYFGPDFKVHGTFYNNSNQYPWRFYVDFIHLLPFLNADEFEVEYGSKPEFIAISDTDTIYQTPVSPLDLFDDQGRPIIIGRLPTNKKDIDNFWRPMTAATSHILKKPEAMRCMTYFPVIFKVEHLRDLAKHIENIHGMPFYDFISDLNNKHIVFDQFGLMCNFVWYYHRDEYDWHLQRSNEQFDVTTPTGAVSLDKLKELSGYKDLIKPVARVAQHFKCSKFTKSQKLFNHITYCQTCKETGICKDLKKYNDRANCSQINMENAFNMFFEFEVYMGWQYDKDVNIAYQNHFNNVREMIKKKYWTMNTTILDYMIKNDIF